MRYYNHYDLHQIGEEQDALIRHEGENYSPIYPCRLEKISISCYQIIVDQPLFSNPVFEMAFSKAYRVDFVRSRTPYQLLLYLNQPSHFTEIVLLDFHRVFDEVMEEVICKSSITAPVIALKPKRNMAS